MKRLIMAVAVGFGLFGLVAVPDMTPAKSIKKTIKNPSERPANDLHVCTEDEPNNTTHAPGWLPPQKNGNGSNCVDWPAGSGLVVAGGSVTVTVNTGHDGKLDDKNTYLTRDDTVLTVTPCTCGCGKACCSCLWVVDGNNTQKFGLSGAGGGGEHTLTIVNAEPVPVVYANVHVWVQNNNASGEVDSLETFDFPTGVQSTMVPPVIQLAAFQDTTFFLEPYITNTYDLFIADEMNSCHPTIENATIAVGEAPAIATGIGDTPGPARFDMRPNYPNPFNPSTTIGYTIPQAGHVRLEIYDVNGHRLATLVDETKSAGDYSVKWDGRDSGGALLASGTYFARLEFEGSVRSRTIVLLK